MQDLKPIIDYLETCDSYYIIATKGATHMSAIDSIYDDNTDMYHVIVTAMLGSLEGLIKEKKLNSAVVLALLNKEYGKHFPELKVST